MGHWNPALTLVNVLAADVTGDGRPELVARDSNNNWYVAFNKGTTFTVLKWGSWPTDGKFVDIFAADMYGYGFSEIIGRNTVDGKWNVLYNVGNKFNNYILGAWSTSITWKDVRVGDVNADGIADIVGRNAATGELNVSVSSVGHIPDPVVWGKWSATAPWTEVRLMDFNGDGRADLLGKVSNTWYVAVSFPTSKFATQTWGMWTPETYTDIVVRDFNGDGLADIAARNSKGEWQVLRNTGAAFAALAKWGAWTTGGTWKDVRGGVI
jgi:hypothetical protein